MILSIVPMQRDAGKLKFFSFAASLKYARVMSLQKNAYYLWFAATGGKKRATNVNQPIIFQLHTFILELYSAFLL